MSTAKEILKKKLESKRKLNMEKKKDSEVKSEDSLVENEETPQEQPIPQEQPTSQEQPTQQEQEKTKAINTEISLLGNNNGYRTYQILLTNNRIATALEEILKAINLLNETQKSMGKMLEESLNISDEDDVEQDDDEDGEPEPE